MTRRIVDLKDVNTQELVYPATHSDAVLMPDGKTVTEAIANAGGGGGDGAVSVHINVDSSGEYALTKDVANYVTFEMVDAECAFTFADAPTAEDILAGAWAEYKLYFQYSGAVISLPLGVVWSESCGMPIFENGYIYEFSFVPIALNIGVRWLGIWNKTTDKNTITIEFANDEYSDGYTLTASAPVTSDITFMFETGFLLEMLQGETYVETSSSNMGMPIMILGEQGGDQVADDYNIYKLVDKTT